MNIEIAPKSAEIQANWDTARLYCFSLDIDGKIGWRLPSLDELREIFHTENDFVRSWYWSNIEFSDDFAWYQSFVTSVHRHCSKNNIPCHVRPVRDI